MKKNTVPLMVISFVLMNFLFPSVMYSQIYPLITQKTIEYEAERTASVLQKGDAFVSVKFIDIHLENIFEGEFFEIKYDDKNFMVHKERIDITDFNGFCFVGSNDEGCRILFSVLNDDIQGVLECKDGVYAIHTTGQYEYALIKSDPSKMPEACENLPYYGDDEIDEIETSSDYSNNNFINNRNNSTYACKIRVLVLYTQAARLAQSNIKNSISTAVAITNQSFVNSQINYEIELAYAGETNYTEVGYNTDLNRFQSNNDGYIDEVHLLRNEYSADICVLLIAEENACGKAYDIKSNANNAFCVVSACACMDCLIGNYSFAHEIGHLMGCRHDPHADKNIIPYSYGHGFVNTSPQWRTIMAYGSSCNDCPRLQYWSNPNVSYWGSPMGTIAKHNNARVWNERANAVMNFRQPYSTCVIASGHIQNMKYADVIAQQDVFTVGTLNIMNGSTLTMRAGTEVLLQNGFYSEEGSELYVTIENITNCGSSAAFGAEKSLVMNGSESSENKGDIKGQYFNIYPNPGVGIMHIDYSIDTPQSISIELFNFMGQKIKDIVSEYHTEGVYNFNFNTSDIAQGTYFIKITTNIKNEIKKVIIQN